MRGSSNSSGKECKTNSSKTDQRQCDNCNSQTEPMLYVVGTGPGNPDYMATRAKDVLKKVDSVAGYSTYIDLIKDLIKDKKIISTTMTKEVQRVEMAINEALRQKPCALISGGDSGVYAMAGLVFEICKKRNIKLVRGNSIDAEKASKVENQIILEIVPGIPALAAGAALAGAPLTHDFATISLSDLLTPWEKIEKRLALAAEADFVIVIYNPKSKKRDWQLTKAKELILKHRNKNTPVGIVTGAMRENQKVTITRLDNIDKEDVGMQSILFIGSTASVQYLDFIFTPRGYSQKYNF
ncbi:MAG: precorrin-3B C(17)-methyltransferase [Desulfobacteraceae bacterium]|nr:precorrin-3B C(17)-methyltransferase [Desulfobacteraceae bacterium]